MSSTKKKQATNPQKNPPKQKNPNSNKTKNKNKTARKPNRQHPQSQVREFLTEYKENKQTNHHEQLPREVVKALLQIFKNLRTSSVPSNLEVSPTVNVGLNWKPAVLSSLNYFTNPQLLHTAHFIIKQLCC